MDLSNYADWIVIAIVVVIAIFSSISKNKKAAAAKTNTPSLPEKTTADDDPWATIREFMEIPEREVALPEPVSVVEEVDVRNMDGRGRAAMAEDGLAREREEYLAATQGRIPERPRMESRLKKRVVDSENTYETKVDSEVIEEFNARAAILYSEILKPKF